MEKLTLQLYVRSRVAYSRTAEANSYSNLETILWKAGISHQVAQLLVACDQN